MRVAHEIVVLAIMLVCISSILYLGTLTKIQKQENVTLRNKVLTLELQLIKCNEAQQETTKE